MTRRLPATTRARSRLAGLGLAAFAAVHAAGQTAPAPAPAAPAAAAPGYTPQTKASEGFPARFAAAAVAQWDTAVTASAPPPLAVGGAPAPDASGRRIGPPPFDNPPYPDGDWQIGGGPNVIGDPGDLRDSPFPLMQAIYDGPNGQAWYDSRVQIYGWETVSGNVSTSHDTGPGPDANFPEIYDERTDRVEQDQFVVYLERMADESQTDHVDWGFRVAAVYGLDYRFMISRGFLSNQLLVNNAYAGVDLPMMYVNLYLPQVAQGMQIILGRIISLPDIEQQLAPNNLMASHSLVYSFDDYTLWGLWTTTKLSAQWTVQAGLSTGVDVAPWEHDPGRQATGSLVLQWIAPGGQDEWYGGMNSFNNGKFGYNNLQEAIVSYTHKFNAQWWTTFESQYMYMLDCTTAPTAAVPYQNGFFPRRSGFVAEGGLLNYTMYRFRPNAFFTVRNEWYDDPEGARTGFASAYYEGSAGITYWVNKLLVLRPELRFDHSFAATAYDNGTRHSQLTLACDVTLHF